MNKYLYRLFPKIYFIGQQNCIFNYRNFFLWVLEGAIEAILISMFSIYIFGTSSLNNSGHSSDLWIISLTMYEFKYLDIHLLFLQLHLSFQHIPNSGLCSYLFQSYFFLQAFTSPICGYQTIILPHIFWEQFQFTLKHRKHILQFYFAFVLSYLWMDQLLVQIFKGEDTQVVCGS